jgi:hypothetical protein
MLDKLEHHLMVVLVEQIAEVVQMEEMAVLVLVVPEEVLPQIFVLYLVAILLHLTVVYL